MRFLTEKVCLCSVWYHAHTLRTFYWFNSGCQILNLPALNKTKKLSGSKYIEELETLKKDDGDAHEVSL
ncbi:Uncharacterised protein [Mycobacteroides abscessus subsp. abscessus]|nr:Uncharacterised protein [Mycobacteroides abscessus subsp. abscessus]